MTVRTIETVWISLSDGEPVGHSHQDVIMSCCPECFTTKQRCRQPAIGFRNSQEQRSGSFLLTPFERPLTVGGPDTPCASLSSMA
jgi:hypothetical protein